MATVRITVTCDNGHVIGTWDDVLEEKYPFWCSECDDDKRTGKYPWRITAEIVPADSPRTVPSEGPVRPG